MLKVLLYTKRQHFLLTYFFPQVWDLTLTILGLGLLASLPSSGASSCRTWSVLERSAGCSSLLAGPAAFSTSFRGHLIFEKLWGVPGRNLEFTPDLANESPFSQVACSCLTVLGVRTEGFSFRLCSEGYDQPHLKHTCVVEQIPQRHSMWLLITPSIASSYLDAGMGSLTLTPTSWGPMSYSGLVVFPPFRR